MIATNELAACRPPSGTSVLRPTAIPRPQPQHPRSIAPRQSQSRTAYNPLADLLEDDLPAHCSPSQPPLPRVLRRTIESAQHSRDVHVSRKSRGLLDTPLSRGMMTANAAGFARQTKTLTALRQTTYPSASRRGPPRA